MRTRIIKFLKNNWLILLIIAVATFLRFYQLATLPPGLHPDEAANGLDIIGILERGQHAAIFDTNGPREALFFYLQAIPLLFGKYLGVASLNFTPLALRIAPAFIGTVTVWAVYLLGKEFYNKNVGLFGAAAMAVSAWHIQFSRNGFRAIMAPLALCFTFYFLLRAYKKKEIKDFVGLGISLALGFYTYLSFRMVPLVFMALLVYLLIKDRKFITQNIKKLLIAGSVFIIIMIPMFVHFYNVPADIMGRASTSVFNPENNGGSAIKTLGGNIAKTAMMFNFQGDENFRHNLGKTPMLDPLVGVLFWGGVLILIVGLFNIENFILVMWVGALSLPELLTAEGIPHALRIVGIMPVIFIAVGLAVDFLLKKIKKEDYAAMTALIIILVTGYFGYTKYFAEFPSYGETGEAYAEDMVGIGNDIRSTDADRKNILIVGEYGTKTVDFIAHPSKNTWERYEIYDVENNLKLPKSDYKIFVQKDWYEQAKEKLQKIGFSGKLKAVNSLIDGRIIYWTYEKD